MKNNTKRFETVSSRNLKNRSIVSPLAAFGDEGGVVVDGQCWTLVDWQVPPTFPRQESRRKEQQQVAAGEDAVLVIAVLDLLVARRMSSWCVLMKKVGVRCQRWNDPIRNDIFVMLSSTTA